MFNLPLRAFLAVATLNALLLNQVTASTSERIIPSLSVHETNFGTELDGKQRLSVEKIQIRLHTHREIKNKFLLQCFFFKKGKVNSLPIINDTVVFEVNNARFAYEVCAKPIKLSSPGTASKKKSSKKSSAKNPKPSTVSASDFPRAGFIVRLLCDGDVLRLYTSNHPLERLATEHPELLDRAASAKSAQHLNASDLVKK